MKRIFICLSILCFFAESFAQTVNSNFPVGRYKMVVDNVRSYLHISENNRLAFELIDTFSDEDRAGLCDTISVIMPGSYTKTDSSKIAVHLDSIPADYTVEFKHSKDVKKGKVRIRIENFSCNYQDKIILAKKFEPDLKGLSFSDFFSENSTEKIDLITDRSDSLFIVMTFPHYPINDVSGYRLPSDANDIIIKSSQNKRYGYPSAFKIRRGENMNEMIMYDDSKNNDNFYNELFFFFLGDDPDSLRVNPSLLPRDGYEFLTTVNLFSYSPPEKEPELNAGELTPTVLFVPPVVAEEGETIDQRYSSYADALDAAQYGDRLLVLIYDEDDDTERDGSNPFGLPAASEEYDYALNQRFVVYYLGKKDKIFLQRYNIKKAPGIIILSNNERLIYSSQNKSIYDALKLTFGNDVSDPEKLYDSLKEYRY